MGEYRDLVESLDESRPLFIGGKSMGGRVASMVADELFARGQDRGPRLPRLSVPPAGQPEKLRTAHLENLTTPALICQGTRDPFGTREEVDGLRALDDDPTALA